VAGAALYLALEDNERRLQNRLRHIQALDQWPVDLDLVTEAPKLGAGCLRGLKQWCAAHAGARVVIIDTLAIVRPAGKRGESDYVADYATLRGLQGLAGELGIGAAVARLGRGCRRRRRHSLGRRTFTKGRNLFLYF